MGGPERRRVLVDLRLLLAPDDERSVAGAVRSRVRAVPGVRRVEEPRWHDAWDDHDLVRQWGVEQRAPVGGRRVRRITAEVEAEDALDLDALVGEVAWAAIGAVCPTAREEDRRTHAGERVELVADEVPWSSATRVVDGREGDGAPER